MDDDHRLRGSKGLSDSSNRSFGAIEAMQCRGNLAAVYESLGRPDEAMAQYARCLALSSQDVECQRGMARAYGAVRSRK